MLKEMKYSNCSIDDVILDLADEIKNGWKIFGFKYPEFTFHPYGTHDMTIEVTLKKEFEL